MEDVDERERSLELGNAADLLEVERDEFFVPSSKNDLKEGSGSFSLHPMSLDECMDHLGDDGATIRQELKQLGLEVLSTSFRPLCSTLWHFQSMNDGLYAGVFRVVLEATGMALDRAANATKEGGAVKANLRSLCKIGFFLLCNYVDHLQKELSAPKSRKGGQAAGSDRRTDSLRKLEELALDRLKRLSDPHQNVAALWIQKPEKEFVSLLLQTLARFCEDANLVKTYNKETTDKLVLAFSGAIASFDCEEEYFRIMMRLFQRNEAAGSLCARVVADAYDKAGKPEIVSDLFSVLEGDMDDIAQTNALGKSYVNVIEGLAKTHPISAALCTEDIAELLKSDAAPVRSVVLHLLTCAIIDAGKIPSGSASDLKEHMDEWWACLLDEILDHHANVRKKVLNCVDDIVAANTPIGQDRFEQVFAAVIGRTGLNDKAQSVREAALKCLRRLLSSRLDLLKKTSSDMEDEMRESVEKLITLLPEETADDFRKPWLCVENWILLKKGITLAAADFSKTGILPPEVREAARGQQDCKRIIKEVSDALETNEGGKAFYFLMAAAKKFPHDKLMVDHQLQGFLGEYGTELLPHRLLSLLDCLKQIRDSKKANVAVLEKSLASFLSMLTNDHNKGISALSEHILKLQSDLRIRRVLCEAVPKWEKTLQMSVATDISEISSFLIFADNNGFKEGVCVLRRLPIYFTSETREIRDAAVSAYRSYFVGEESVDRSSDALVERLIRELPNVAAANSETIKLLFKDENNAVTEKVAKRIVGIALSTDDAEDVWRACLALSVLPSVADGAICDKLEPLRKKCLDVVPFDTRLVCTFCDVLIKLGRSPLDKDDVTTRNKKKLTLPTHHSVLYSFLNICIQSFSDVKAKGQTIMYGKMVEALFAVAEKPSDTLKLLISFVLTRLKITGKAKQPTKKSTRICRVPADGVERMDVDQERADESSNPPLEKQAVALDGLHYVLYLGATAAFTYANWMEDVFSLSAESKESQAKKAEGEFDEDEPDGPNEEDRGKEAVLQFRKRLFKPETDGENSGIWLIENLVVKMTEMSFAFKGRPAGLVAYMALIRIMLISEHSCNRHIRRIIRVLDTTESLELRKMLLVGFSDIAVRFVNMVQEHTSIYTKQLRHPHPSVRYHALMAFVRIIVNDLVKVREQYCDIAMLICDPDAEVSTVTRGFFKEKLSKTDVMNVVTQLLARNDLPEKLDQSHMQEVFKYLIDLVGKNVTEMDSLTVSFFAIVESKRPVEIWQIVAFCLTLVVPHMSEKLLLQLREQVFNWKKAVADETTMKYLIDAFNGCRRKLPEDKKRLPEDIVARIESLHNDNAEVSARRSSRRADTGSRASRRAESLERNDSPQPSGSRRRGGNEVKKTQCNGSGDKSKKVSKTDRQGKASRGGQQKDPYDPSSSEEDERPRKQPVGRSHKKR
ncbi:hypothetical protein RvY_00864 [Ramazzottius varieornatus]|uniref:Condensin complex subunit 1 C-terminal domain-containing protein n=1 Tax=Ramazzottius varieornatus TaxID=947166 RepID=A0A1D1UPM0_RAMVA|nr:hypothetical protein RvY_00864 [Ramazzottius varieornatus]